MNPNRLVKCDCCGKSYVYEASPMIKDFLWEQISNEHFEGDYWVSEILCLDCMEKRLGRKITLDDLGDYIYCYHNREFLKYWWGKT